MDTDKSIVVIFKSNGMGDTTAQPLKDKLTGTYLRLLDQISPLPRVICFYTEGVRMACEGSPVLDQLKLLEAKGVHLILCQTCLDFFGLKDQVRVGIIGGMADILTAMWEADSVITL